MARVAMELRILGPLEIAGENGPVDLRATKHRRLLAAQEPTEPADTKLIDYLEMWEKGEYALALQVLEFQIEKATRLSPRWLRDRSELRAGARCRQMPSTS